MSETAVPHIAIVGAGYSGTQTLAELVRHARAPLSIQVVESQHPLGQGVAYSTMESVHLLNVRAAKMGAFADDPGGFYKWLQTEVGRQAVASFCPELEVTPEAFMPRAVYGAYLTDGLRRTVAEAAHKGIEVRFHKALAVDAELVDPVKQRLRLWLEQDGERSLLEADVLVLATGNLPPKRFRFVDDLVDPQHRYVPDLWNPSPSSVFPWGVAQLSKDSEVVIVGTGLTMVDALLTLDRRGFPGRVTAVSRHGLLPQDHAADAPCLDWSLVTDPESAPQTTLGLLASVRRQVREAAKRGATWQNVVDSLRSLTPWLWQRLSLRDKRRFLTRLLPYWSVHRHRMAPNASATVQQWLTEGRLRIIAGQVVGVSAEADRLRVSYRQRGTELLDTTSAALLLNCTGPDGELSQCPNRLLRNLLARKLISSCPLRLGIERTPLCTARGPADCSLFVLGFLGTGDVLESTAVPDLRLHAAQVAHAVLRRIATQS